MDALPYRSPLNAGVVNCRQHRQCIPTIKPLAHKQQATSAHLLIDQVAFAPEDVAVAWNVAEARYESPENRMRPIVGETGDQVVPRGGLLSVIRKESA
jgi:hypothetical protein